MEANAHKQQCEVDRLRQEAAEASHLLADGVRQAQQARAEIEEQAEQIRDLSLKLQVQNSGTVHRLASAMAPKLSALHDDIGGITFSAEQQSHQSSQGGQAVTATCAAFL